MSQRRFLAYTNTMRYHVFPLISFLAVLLFAAAPSGATKYNLEKIDPLPELPAIPAEEFEAQTKLVTHTPYKDPELAYSIRVPEDWEVKLDNGEKDAERDLLTLPGMVASYISPPENLARSEISLEVQELGYEISARNWFLEFILSHGLSLMGLTETDSRHIEAVYVRVINDETKIVRAKVIINGSHILVFRYALPIENFNASKVLQANVLDSITLENPVQRDIEARDTHSFLDQVYLSYPQSWTLKAPRTYSLEKIQALLYNDLENDGVYEGQMRVRVVSRILETKLSEELAKFREGLNIPGYTAGDVIEKLPIGKPPHKLYADAQLYRLNATQTSYIDYELGLLVMADREFYYFVSLITPSRTEDFGSWARNIEGLRAVANGFRTVDDLEDEDVNN